MDDKHGEVFRQYDLKVYNMYRARGAFLIETNQGLKLFKSFEGSKNHLLYENRVKEMLVAKGCPQVDLLVRNRLGECISEDSMGVSYIIKDWFVGEECNLKDQNDVYQASSNLAKLHNAMQGIENLEEGQSYISHYASPEVFEKHNRELKRVRTYINSKKQRNEFELQFLLTFDAFYQEALKATEMMGASSYQKLLEESIESGKSCHGNYTYHNLIKAREGIATTNFDKACVGIQITDLYQFLRKCMEKNDWNLEFGHRIFDGYRSVRPITKEEYEILYILLLYPEKFWKVTNFYFNNKKSWISKRNIQKLTNLEQQAPMKTKFLEHMFSEAF